MTLPELLISIVITGMVMAGLMAAATVMLRQVDNTEGRTNNARSEQNINLWMPTDLTSAESVDHPTPAGFAVDPTPPAIGTVFEAIWAEGLAGDAPLVLDGLAARLGLADAAAANADPVVKDRLRANTDAALAAGVFGVPTLAVEGELFWGNDSHDLMLAVLEDPGLLRQGELAGVAAIPVGVERRR